MRVCNAKIEQQLNAKDSKFQNLQSFPSSLSKPLDGKKHYMEKVPGCFVVNPLMTENECDELVDELEKMHFQSLKNEFPEEERNNRRIMVLNEELAALIWKRVEAHFDVDDVLFIKPIGFGNEGCWRPSGLNECLKFSKYEKVVVLGVFTPILIFGREQSSTNTWMVPGCQWMIVRRFTLFLCIYQPTQVEQLNFIRKRTVKNSLMQ